MFRQHYWLVKGCVFVTEYAEHITLDDARSAAPSIAQTIRQQGNPDGVHLVLDATSVNSFDRSIFNYNEWNKINGIIHEGNIILSNPIIYAHSFPMVLMILNLLSRVFKSEIILINTWEETIDYLLNLDPDLRGLLKLPEVDT